MSHNGSRAAKHFEKELSSLIERFRLEYELTYAEAVGVLETAKLTLFMELNEDGQD